MAAALAMILGGTASAQQKADPKGGISTEMLKEIRTGYQGTASDKAIKNIFYSQSPADSILHTHPSPMHLPERTLQTDSVHP